MLRLLSYFNDNPSRAISCRLIEKLKLTENHAKTKAFESAVKNELIKIKTQVVV